MGRTRSQADFKSRVIALAVCLAIVFAWQAFESWRDAQLADEAMLDNQASSVSMLVDGVPEYHGQPYDTMPGKPFAEGGISVGMSSSDLTGGARVLGFGYEEYVPLDSLGRCGSCLAVVGLETMPASGEERGSIGAVRPSGWALVKYDFVSGKYLYNRCHLIGWQLTAENGNPSNLVTGTRTMNVRGMLPFEDDVADYVRSTGNHVLYRATPMFVGDELVCRGVVLEAQSVEDAGDSVSFKVFCHNVEPGVEIDYATGESRVSDGA